MSVSKGGPTIMRGGNMAKSKAHPGFKAVQHGIAQREGISEERAGAILASSSRNASAAAKKKNPNLKKVKG
jgi:hypothetical protein